MHSKILAIVSTQACVLSLVAAMLGASLPPASAQPAPTFQVGSLQQTPAIHAGVYRATNGTWVPLTGGSMPAADVIFNNTALSPYYMPIFTGQTLYYGGVVPSPTNPSSSLFRPGCATEYLISGFEFAYCTDQPTIDVELEFYDSFEVCAVQHPDPIKALIPFIGLPGSPTPGTQVCYIVLVDLRGAGGGLTFWLDGDGDGVYDPPLANRFGFGFRVPNVVGSNTGPVLAGNPAINWSGTRWYRYAVDYSEPGTGRNTYGQIERQPQGTCIDLFPEADGLYLRLFSDACGALAGEPFCTGDGSAAPCPCSNVSPSANREGCHHSINGVNGGRFEATGVASLSNDTVTLKSIRLPTTTPVLFFQGTTRQNGGLGAAFGDGLRCAGGVVTRLASKQAIDGETFFPVAGELPVSVQGVIQGPGTRTYQVWYRNSAAFCTSSTFNLTNGWEIVWQS